MKIDILTGNPPIAEISGNGILISNTQEALDIMANCVYQGCNHFIFYEENLSPDFFDLKSRLAGDILQKFSNYRCNLSIVGNFDKCASKSLRDFIYESNKGKQISFVTSREEAIKKLSGRT